MTKFFSVRENFSFFHTVESKTQFSPSKRNRENSVKSFLCRNSVKPTNEDYATQWGKMKKFRQISNLFNKAVTFTNFFAKKEWKWIFVISTMMCAMYYVVCCFHGFFFSSWSKINFFLWVVKSSAYLSIPSGSANFTNFLWIQYFPPFFWKTQIISCNNPTILIN